MKKKHFITALTVIIFALALFLILVNVFDIHFNFVKYHSIDSGSFSFTFKGSFGEVRKVTVKQDGKVLDSAEFAADPSVFDNDSFAPLFLDINTDGKNDILLPFAFDEDGDVHYTAYLLTENKLVSNDAMKDLSDPYLGEDGMVYTEFEKKEILSPKTDKSPEKYETYHTIAKHGFIDGNFVTLETRSLIYYSESDYCCYSVYLYDETFKELTYFDEKWFDPIAIGDYPLNWD